jgi:hypothetical protein
LTGEVIRLPDQGFPDAPLLLGLLGEDARHYGRESIHALTQRVRANLSYLLRNKRVVKTGDRLTGGQIGAAELAFVPLDI